ncbi:MAG: ABC transporter permease, partial [Acidobacteriota bacterium]
IVHAVLLRALPYERPEELVVMWESTPRLKSRPFSEASFLDWRQHSNVFSEMSGFLSQQMSAIGKGQPASVSALKVSANLFDLLGVSPASGRGFSEQDGLPGAQPVVVLTHGFWQSQYGSSEQVFGQAINLDGVPHTIIGILPPSFFFPPPLQHRGVVRQFEPQLFVPLACDPEERLFFRIFAAARLKPEVSISQAQSHLKSVANTLIEERPEFYSEGLQAELAPLHQQGVASSRSPLMLLLGAAGFILLIACFNVATLILARASGRFKEIAVRSALGAARGRIVRLLLTENLLLALLGGVAGALVAQLSMRPLLEIGARFIPLSETASIEWPVLVFTFAVALLTGIVFGLVPALQLSKSDLVEAMNESSRGNSGGLTQQRLRTAMVVTEVALAVVLLVGAGLLLRSLWRLQNVELGFEPRNVVAIRIQLPENRYEELRQIDFVHRLEREVRSLPGVGHASIVTLPPLAPGRAAGRFGIEGRPSLPEQDGGAQLVSYRQVSPDYFKTMKIPLSEGRVFTPGDNQDSAEVCIIDRTLAQTRWPDSSPLGSRIIFPARAPDPLRARIVGVMDDVMYTGLKSSWSTIYFPLAQQPDTRLYLLVRSSLGTEAISDAVHGSLAKIDPDLPADIQTYESLLYEAQSGGRSPTFLLGIFAFLALALALGGLYGFMSFIVGQQHQEIGVRMALGAQSWDITRHVDGRIAMMVAVGLLLGLGAAWALSRTLSSLLFEVSPSDPATFAAVAVLFVLVSALAVLLPTRRACKVDPIAALRAE